LPIGSPPCCADRCSRQKFAVEFVRRATRRFFNAGWGGYPEAKFLAALDPQLERVRKTLPDKVYTAANPAGTLSANWADRLGLRAGISGGGGAAFDVHLGAVGSGIAPGTLVKIMGTSDVRPWR